MPPVAKLLGTLILWGKAALVFLVFFIFSRVVAKFFANFASRHFNGKRDVIELLGKTTTIGILVLGIITALECAKLPVEALITSLGLTGFALGFAFKDALSNLLAGAMILFYRPFGRGSRINVANFEGVVSSIDLRYTVLKADGKKFLVPNSTLLSNIITVAEDNEERKI